MKNADILLVHQGNQRLHRILATLPYTIHQAKNPENLPKDTQYSLVLFDAMPAEAMIHTCVGQYPDAIHVVYIEDKFTETQPLFYETLDEIIVPPVTPQALDLKLQWLLSRRQQRQRIKRYQRNLSWMKDILQLNNQTSSIQQVFGAVCERFGLRQILILPQNHQEASYLFSCDTVEIEEMTTYAQPYDPFAQVIETGKNALYNEITSHPYYAPLPYVENPSSVIIIKLPEDTGLATLALYGKNSQALTQEDLSVFEIFASSVDFTQLRRVRARPLRDERELLSIWQQFISMSNDRDIAQHLRKMFEGHPKIDSALVWLDVQQDAPYIIAPDDQTKNLFAELMAGDAFDTIFDHFHDSLKPLLIWQDSASTTRLTKRLFEQMNADRLHIFPIVDSTRMVGIVVGGLRTGRSPDERDIEALENLIFTAAQTLERKTFATLMYEESNRLEAILKSIAEGTFFVDEDDRVVFCNPQVTELTGISRTQIMDQPSQVLLEQLAQRSDSPESVLPQLREAVQGLAATGDYYPIVKIQSTENHLDVSVELTAIDVVDGQPVTWAGFIREGTSQVTPNNITSTLLQVVAEQASSPQTEINDVIQKMLESRTRLTPKTIEHYLRKLADRVDRLRLTWDSFFELYRIDRGRIGLDKEELPLERLIEYACDTSQLRRTEWQYHVNMTGPVPTVEADVLLMSQALANLILAAIAGAKPTTVTQIGLSSYDNQAQIVISNDLYTASQQGLRDEIQITDRPEDVNSYLSFHFGAEMIRKHGGSLHTEAHRGRGTMITIMMPLVNVEDTIVEPEYVSDGIPPAAPAQPSRGQQTIIVHEGTSALTQRVLDMLTTTRYEVLVSQNIDELLQDINTIRIDLILIDQQHPTEEGLAVAQAVRQKTSVPIIMLSDSASSDEKTQAYQNDIDEYFDQNAGDGEVLARIDTLFNRASMTDRVSEPIRIGGLYINLARREVLLDSKPLDLTRIEYDLLRYLAINANQVLEHEQLLTKVWGPEYRDEKHYLWVNISRLRKKLEPKKESPRYIYNRPGIGYMLKRP